MGARVAVYFVASPLQYLAARRIAENFEAGARQVLVWYKPGVTPIVREADWDAASCMPWRAGSRCPAFGRHRRLRDNIRRVAGWWGPATACDPQRGVRHRGHQLLPARLPKACRARGSRPHPARRHHQHPPLSAGPPPSASPSTPAKLRRLVAPELDYWCFGGDRIGSDAPFCDRIYVIAGLPHEYPADKVVVLPPLVTPRAGAAGPRPNGHGPRHRPAAGRRRPHEARRPRRRERRDPRLAGRLGIRRIIYKATRRPGPGLKQPDYTRPSASTSRSRCTSPTRLRRGRRGALQCPAVRPPDQPGQHPGGGLAGAGAFFKSDDERRQMGEDLPRSTGSC